MIQILVVDDDSLKANKIAEVINFIPGCSLELAHDAVTARKLLQKHFDLLILDINLPERFGEVPQPTKGVDLIKEIKSSKRLKIPSNIIGLTGYDDILTRFKDEFAQSLYFLIKYDLKGIDWQNRLKDKVDELVSGNTQDAISTSFNFDIAFICALRSPELEQVLNLPYNWNRLRIENDASTYYQGKFQINSTTIINIVATSLPQMGMVSTAATTMKVIHLFQPRYIVMTGICGGIKGKVQLGDIIISDQSFDFGSGKIIVDETGLEKFEPDFKPIPLSGDFKEELIELSTQKSILRSLQDKWQGNPIHNELRIHIGPMASGAAVVANSGHIGKIVQFQRKLLGIDMETYSIFYCSHYTSAPRPIALSIKSVSDFADSHKNDDIQSYSAFISAVLADYIVQNILTFS